MTSKYLSGVLIVALSLALVTPARPDTLKTDSHEIVAGIAGAAAAIAVVVTIVAIHYSKKRSITGCVAAAGDSMTITDERDGKIYSLSGSSAGITSGHRWKLQGRRVKPAGSDQKLEWDVTREARDFGVCQP
jgi:hypothetical protein